MRGIFLIGFVGLSGCATAPAVSGASGSQNVRVVGAGGDVLSVGIPTTLNSGTTTIALPADKLWSVLPAVYDSLGIPLTEIDPSSRVLGNRGMKLRRRLAKVPLSTYIDCGTAQAQPSADSYDINLSVMTQLQIIDPGDTKVTTTVDAVGRPVSFSGEDVRCATKGAIERRISRLLESVARQ